MPHHTLCQSLTGLHPPLPRSIKLFHQPLWQFQMCRSWAQGYVLCHLLDWCFLLQRFHLALGLVCWVFHTNPCVSYLYKHFTWYLVSLQARFWFESFWGRVGLYLFFIFFPLVVDWGWGVYTHDFISRLEPCSSISWWNCEPKVCTCTHIGESV